MAIDNRQEKNAMAQRRYRDKRRFVQDQKRLNMYISSESYDLLKIQAKAMNLSLKACLEYVIDSFSEESTFSDGLSSEKLSEMPREALVRYIENQAFWLERYKALNTVFLSEKNKS